MADAVRFVLGDRVVEAACPDPTMTVLQWLRANARSGTKEGCAEGDCGACTVVVGEAEDGKVRYRAVNACILFLPQIDGKQLITVEDLARGDALHPVQRAMVDTHASQCGFCTPGFVMALFALHRADRNPDAEAVHDALAGNLCRCTGYRPILEAARRMGAEAVPDHYDAAEPATVALLEALRRPAGLTIAGPGKTLHQPRTLAELEALTVAHPDATILAGGTDVGLWVTKHLKTLPTVIHLAEVAELKTVTEADDHIEVGAAVTYTRLLPVLERRIPELVPLIRRIGAGQVRNSGTLVGNVANGSPIGDSMPALLALGASVVLNRGGDRRTLDLDAFYLGYRKTALQPGEVVERVRIPLLKPEHRFATWKVSKRRDQDISAVCAAFRLTLAEDGTVAELRTGYGGVAAIPARARHLEAALTGQPWTEAALAGALPELDRDFTPLTDMRASDAYRRSVARNLVRRFYLHSTGAAAYALEASHG